MNYKVPFFDLKQVNISYESEYIKIFSEVLGSGQLILGSQLQKFETEFAEYCGAKYSVGVGNALDGIYFMLLAAGIGPGDEVIVPANTYIATWLAVSRTGAKIVPVEPRIEDYNIDPSKIEQSINSNTKAILVVHLYGKIADMVALKKIADKHKIYLFDDAAQAHGGGINSAKVGSLADATTFSFYPTKNLGALGDGGAITTNDLKMYQKFMLLRNYGSPIKYLNTIIGYNSRLDEMQAAFLRLKLPKLEEANEARTKSALKYYNLLSSIDSVELPKISIFSVSNVWHLFVIRHPERDNLRKYLAENGVECLIHYPVPPHLQEAYKHLGFSRGSFPITEKIHDEVLSLPLWPGLKNSDIEFVCNLISVFNK